MNKLYWIIPLMAVVAMAFGLTLGKFMTHMVDTRTKATDFTIVSKLISTKEPDYSGQIGGNKIVFVTRNENTLFTTEHALKNVGCAFVNDGKILGYDESYGIYRQFDGMSYDINYLKIDTVSQHGILNQLDELDDSNIDCRPVYSETVNFPVELYSSVVNFLTTSQIDVTEDGFSIDGLYRNGPYLSALVTVTDNDIDSVFCDLAVDGLKVASAKSEKLLQLKAPFRTEIEFSDFKFISYENKAGIISEMATDCKAKRVS